jgi:hypothetical protein
MERRHPFGYEVRIARAHPGYLTAVSKVPFAGNDQQPTPADRCPIVDYILVKRRKLGTRKELRSVTELAMRSWPQGLQPT